MCNKISSSDMKQIKKIIKKIDDDSCSSLSSISENSDCSSSESCCKSKRKTCKKTNGSSKFYDCPTLSSCPKSCNGCGNCSNNLTISSSSESSNCFNNCQDKIRINVMPANNARNPGASIIFYSIVTPVTNLSSGNMDSIEFTMRRKNKTITLQWRDFKGVISANGVPNLTVCNSISNLPLYQVNFAIFIIYKGVGRITHLTIDPYSQFGQGNIYFFLNTEGNGTGISMGDSFEIPGGSVTWISNI